MVYAGASGGEDDQEFDFKYVEVCKQVEVWVSLLFIKCQSLAICTVRQIYHDVVNSGFRTIGLARHAKAAVVLAVILSVLIFLHTEMIFALVV